MAIIKRGVGSVIKTEGDAETIKKAAKAEGWTEADEQELQDESSDKDDQ